MGGRLKSLPLSQLKIKPRMHLLVYGEARYLFNKQFSCSIFDTLEDIFIHLSQEKFLPKIILFTPGCSSLDQFTSYQ
jgi:UDP-N-acetylmuramoylalanine-D-glutamate ligase